MIGASIYLKTFDMEYIKLLKSKNITRIFTSLHIPEDDFDMNIIKEMFEVTDMEYIIDISPATFELLNISKYEELKQYGIKTVRLDYGFNDMEVVKEVQNNFNIVLNASIINEEYILKLKDNGIDPTKIHAMHNFYPKMYSGLTVEVLKEKNEILKKFGVNIMAFVSGDLENRFPTYEGLITCESHRGMDPYCAAYELLNECNVDEVFVGDGICSEYLLNRLININNVTQIRATLLPEFQHLYNTEIQVRNDSNINVIRLNTRDSKNLVQKNCKLRTKGSICVTNNLYGRYQNEIEIYNIEAGFDARYNTIGYICPEDLLLLNYNLHCITFVAYE